MDALMEPKMAKKKGRPKTSGRDDMAVKVDRKIVGVAKIVAANRGIPLAEYLSELLEPLVNRDITMMVQVMKKGKAKSS